MSCFCVKPITTNALHDKPVRTRIKKINIPAVSAGKYATSTKGGAAPKLENMRPVPSAGKHAAGTKRGKTCGRYQAREYMRPVPSAGKHAAGTKRGKACSWYQARERMQPVTSAGKSKIRLVFSSTCLTDCLRADIVTQVV